MCDTAMELNSHFLDLCYRIAGRSQAVAALLYGSPLSGCGDDAKVNILLIISHFGSRLKTYEETIGEKSALVIAVDRGIFERDVSAGWLGEITAEKLLLPYYPLINADYLWLQEVALKRRVIWELLESIVLEFPELCLELSIKQEYFLYETQVQRARLFPPAAFCFLNVMRKGVREKNVELMMHGYIKALEELSRERWITFTNGTVRITPKLVNAIKSGKIRIPIFLRSVQRATLAHVLSALPRMMKPLTSEEEAYFRTHNWVEERDDVTLQLGEPRDYLLMSTPAGPVPLSDATTIEDFVRKTVPGNVEFGETRRIGGILNSVYQLTVRRERDDHEQRIVVKKFKDWTGVKWFPLTLWSLGTKSFAVLGKSRLEREYAINQYLMSQGLTVPTILYISPKQKLIFQEYVEGRNLGEIIKEIVTSKDYSPEELGLVNETGRNLAKAHRLGVGLGDCKPENIVVTKEGKICFVDLEQASRNGDATWDIAEFLYYSGHYVPPLAATDQMMLLSKAFLEGYVDAGGELQTIKKAASPQYTKVFSIFTQPHVILAISTLCRRIDQK